MQETQHTQQTATQTTQNQDKETTEIIYRLCLISVFFIIRIVSKIIMVNCYCNVVHVK